MVADFHVSPPRLEIELVLGQSSLPPDVQGRIVKTCEVLIKFIKRQMDFG